jgi:HEAT repeat protein
MLKQWIDDLQSADAAVRNRAVRELQQLGPEARTAVPALIAALRKTGGDIGLAGSIAYTLGAIGPDARAAVPLLLRRVKPDRGGDSSFPFAILRIGAKPAHELLALRSLLMIHSGGWDSYPIDLWDWEKDLMRPCADRIVPGLADLLTDSDAFIRSRASSTLAGYGSQAARAVPALVTALNDPDFWARTQVALALVAVEPGHKNEAIAAMSPLLTNDQGMWTAFHTLRQLGEDPIAILLQQLRGSSEAGRRDVARALGFLFAQAQTFGLLASPAFEEVARLLTDADAGVRDEAALALVEIDAARAGPALPQLTDMLDSTDTPLRQKVVRLLVRMGPAAEPALPALVKLMSGPELALEAALALVEIKSPSASLRPGGVWCPEATLPVIKNIDAQQAAITVGVLADALDPSSPSWWQIMEALGKIGAPAAAAAPLLQNYLQGQDIPARINAASALARILPEDPEWRAIALPTLVALEALVDEPVGDFWAALATLAALGPAARDVVPQLEVMLFDQEKRGQAEWICRDAGGDPVARLFAALVKIDPTTAARVLRRMAESQWDSLLKALADLGPAAAPLVPDLQELLPAVTPEQARQLEALTQRTFAWA